MSRRWIGAAFGTAAVALGVYLTVAIAAAWGDLVAAAGIAVWVATVWTGFGSLWLDPVAVAPFEDAPSVAPIRPFPWAERNETESGGEIEETADGELLEG